MNHFSGKTAELDECFRDTARRLVPDDVPTFESWLERLLADWQQVGRPGRTPTAIEVYIITRGGHWVGAEKRN